MFPITLLADDNEYEPKPRKPKRYRCQDMMCGALDCWTCYPDPKDHEEKEED